MSIIISTGNSVFNTTMSTSTLNDVIETIKADLKIKKVIKNVRSINNKKKRSEYKTANLPYFNLGIFQDNQRKTEHFLSSEFMIADIDNLDEQQLPEVKNKLHNDDRVYIYFLSPSGNGFKVVYRFSETITDSKKFTENYKFYAQQLSDDYGVETDKTSDAARACFFSHDPNLYLNERAECLEVKEFVETVDKLDFTKVDTSKKENKIKKDDETYVPHVIKFLSQKIDNDDDWYKCGMALASLGERGRSYFQELSRNPNYPADTAETVDKKFSYFLKEKKGAINLPTIFNIAIKKYKYKYPTDIQPLINPVKNKPFYETLLERFEFDDSRDPDEPIGYKLQKFSSIEKELDGIQPGYYHIGAYSNVGKSAILHNLALDLIHSNDELQVLFFSQDDPKLYTSYRLIALLGYLTIQESKKGIGAMKNDEVSCKQLEEARSKYIELLKKEKLVLMDTSDIYEFSKLNEVVTSNYEKNKNLVVFIDGLYNLEIGENAEGLRAENIQRANYLKKLTDIYQIPVFTTGELRKKNSGEKSKKPTIDDLMESGKFAYNANAVWLLYEEDTSKNGFPEVEINLEYAKNKIGGFKGKQKFIFVRAKGEISEGFLSPTVRTDHNEEEEV